MSQSRATDEEAIKRKVRKGTHSCWECRRRKIRCQFSSDEDTICIGCRTRGCICRSQEFPDESKAKPASEPKLPQRLERLEAMMEQLMQHVMTKNPRSSTGGEDSSSFQSSRGQRWSFSDPSNTDDDTGGSPGSTAEPAAAVSCPTAMERYGYKTTDVFESSTTENNPVTALLGIQDSLSQTSPPDMVSPRTTRASIDDGAHQSASTAGRGIFNPCAAMSEARAISVPVGNRYRHLSESLHRLFPSQEDIHTIAGSMSALYVVSLFHSRHDLDEGRGEDPKSLMVVPPATSHPTVIARRLLQLVLCMQSMAPCFTLQKQLQISEPLPKVIGCIVNAVCHDVTSNEDLISNLEGLQCLVLLGQQQSNEGHLRKAWLNYRRALSLAQLMGLDRGSTRALKSCDPAVEDPRSRPTPAALWGRVNASERYLSLILGLRAGVQGDDVYGDSCEKDTPVEKLEKAHTVLTGRIIERNHSPIPAALPYSVTLAIDADLQCASLCGLDASWWDAPSYDPYAPPTFIFQEMSRSILQVSHHCIVILLHLPYMLRNRIDSVPNACAGNGSSAYSTGNTTDTANIANTEAGRAAGARPGGDTAYVEDTTYSRDRCMQSSRAVLQRFIKFREIVNTAFSCRHIDYATLIAAMTLIIGYLGPRPAATDDLTVRTTFDEQLDRDRNMIQQVCNRMHQIGETNSDKMFMESVTTIRQLQPLFDIVAKKTEQEAACSGTVRPAALATAATSTSPIQGAPAVPAPHQGHISSQNQADSLLNPSASSSPAYPQTSHAASAVRFTVPYLGTVNIHPSTTAAQHSAQHTAQHAAQHLHTQMSGHDAHVPLGSSSSLDLFTGSQQPNDNLASWQGGDLAMCETDPPSQPDVPDLNMMMVDFDAMTDENGAPFDFGTATAFPDLIGANEDWVMQGVDTTYWSLLNGKWGSFGGP